MTFTPGMLYLFTFSSSLVLSLVLVPAARSAALVLDIFDRPISSVKTHKQPVPYLGGVAILVSFVFSLIWIRVLTSFPSGTLRSLRGILCGGALLSLLGLVDDVKHHGLHYWTKFGVQILAALMVLAFGVRIKFIQPSWFASVLTVIWIVGVTNAFNLIDIMDGLASGVGAVASAAFLFIALPTEDIYVNFAAAAMCGALLGFMPYNLSKRLRIFMGDSGSLLLGFVCSALAMGTSYSQTNRFAVFAPLLILAIPIFDTVFVSYCRIRRGISPFVGSKDHFPLRLEAMGWNRPMILAFTLTFASILCFAAFVATVLSKTGALAVFAGAGALLAIFTAYVLRAPAP
ncbi:MAG: undecaprenyl/decaprenyl-phosphate alpha-N-acetylglucosaminyl 1-phosphate transferase [Elusimicrobia bacterium]|nr:undecaprenyl/decaprenyl-phosphate alpha-N-acetylglucosaminyl 1-phosphate transferase [Elusimicrobiota bacterium]